MLVMDVGDGMYWWQLYDDGDNFGLLFQIFQKFHPKEKKSIFNYYTELNNRMFQRPAVFELSFSIIYAVERIVFVASLLENSKYCVISYVTFHIMFEMKNEGCWW